ncbi:hypothetical protein HC341_08690 [Aquisalimonas sp. 2447]|uniref:conjugative transfer protein MobI(A/C) n=1 Tax=Aquisalimonas sp. 2447 TaxID=2740807 RepID=UPI0014327D0B|nr:conjugative transfer protein MobI(A/C) [Aquisalimonas sp. 2447]QIT55275.1 hypothetical protein HC341_08690 [Aquisalimonas sp. 2447]
MEYSQIEESLDQKEREIAETANHYASEFWNSHYSGNAERPKHERSHLGVRVRHRPNTGNLEIFWVRFSWVQSKDGKNHLRSEHLRKGVSSHGDSETKLLRYAQEWERELVLEVERNFTRLREEFASVRKARVPLRKARKLSAEGGIGSTNKESENTDE